jgi:hypothetical protein
LPSNEKDRTRLDNFNALKEGLRIILGSLNWVKMDLTTNGVSN